MGSVRWMIGSCVAVVTKGGPMCPSKHARCDDPQLSLMSGGGSPTAMLSIP